MKGIYETIRASDSEVPRDDAEHGKSFCDVDIANALFRRVSTVFGGQGGRYVSNRSGQCRVPFVVSSLFYNIELASYLRLICKFIRTLVDVNSIVGHFSV